MGGVQKECGCLHVILEYVKGRWHLFWKHILTAEGGWDVDSDMWMFLRKRRHSYVLDESHSNFAWKVFLLFLGWCNKQNCWQIFIIMSKHIERTNQSFSTTVRMKTDIGEFANAIAKFCTRNISLMGCNYWNKEVVFIGIILNTFLKKSILSITWTQIWTGNN